MNHNFFEKPSNVAVSTCFAVTYVTALCTDQGALITCDVTDEGFPIIIFEKRVKPRMDPALVPDSEGRYLEKEKRFFKNNFKPCSEGQILSLEINL